MSEDIIPGDRTSEIQKRIYEFIVNYMREEGMPPTNREVGAAMNLPSIDHVDYHLTMLEKKGLIERERKKSRGIKLKQPLYGIPVLGTFAAQEPLEVFPDEDIEVIEAGRELGQQGAYALMVRGQSMIEEYICENDYLIIKGTIKVEDGDIVLSIHLQGDGLAVLKRFYLDSENNRVFLLPINSRMNPIFIPKNQWEEEWRVQGTLLAVFRKSVVSRSENISSDVDVIKEELVESIREDGSFDHSAGKEDLDNLTGPDKSNSANKSENETMDKNDLQQSATWEKTLSDKLAQFKIDQDKAIAEAARNFTNQVIHDAVIYDRIVSVIDKAQEQLDQIVVQCRGEAKQWFRYSLLAAILGFLVILGGVVLAIVKLNVSLGFLTALGSIVPDVAALLFFQQRNKTNERLDRFYKEQLNMTSIYKATELTLTTNDKSQDNLKELIIKKWLNIPV